MDAVSELTACLEVLADEVDATDPDSLTTDEAVTRFTALWQTAELASVLLAEYAELYSVVQAVAMEQLRKQQQADGLIAATVQDLRRLREGHDK